MNKYNTDKELLDALRTGCQTAFAQIYHTYHQAVYANICKLVKNDTDAEDLLQEVFTLLWNKRMQLADEQHIGGWLFLTSYYKAMETLKANIRSHTKLMGHDSLADVEDDWQPDNEASFLQKLEILNKAVEELPPQKKSAFTLCRLQGKTYREAAQEMGISEETVKDYIKSSLKFIRNKAHNSGYSTGIYMIGLMAAAIPYSQS